MQKAGRIYAVWCTIGKEAASNSPGNNKAKTKFKNCLFILINFLCPVPGGYFFRSSLQSAEQYQRCMPFKVWRTATILGAKGITKFE